MCLANLLFFSFLFPFFLFKVKGFLPPLKRWIIFCRRTKSLAWVGLFGGLFGVNPPGGGGVDSTGADSTVDSILDCCTGGGGRGGRVAYGGGGGGGGRVADGGSPGGGGGGGGSALTGGGHRGRLCRFVARPLSFTRRAAPYFAVDQVITDSDKFKEINTQVNLCIYKVK